MTAGAAGRQTRETLARPASRRTFRIPDGLYEAVQAKARSRGETVTEVAVRKFAEYVNEDNGGSPP